MNEPGKIPADDTPPARPRQLDYSAYGPSHFDMVLDGVPYIGGLLLASFIVAVIGCMGFPILIHPLPGHPRESRLGYVIGFAIAAIVAGIALAIAILTGNKERRRWFLLGLLTGTCVAALMEGLCFS